MSDYNEFRYESNTSQEIIMKIHLITNKFDVFRYLSLFIIMFVLYFYQCTKIRNYANQRKKFIDFQLLFCILTLIRILELTYSYIGYEIDQWQSEWKIKFIEDKNEFIQEFIFCDPSFKYIVQGKCYVRYEIIGILSNINLYFGIIVVQMATFFWYKQISPLMFISIHKMALNLHESRQTKGSYYFFIIFDIIMLAAQIVVWSLKFEQEAFKILNIFQIVLAGLTAVYFIYNIWDQHKNGEKLFSANKLKVYCIATFLLARTGFIIMRFVIYNNNEFRINEEQPVYLSYLYISFNIIDMLSRILLINLF